ncbi:MAG: amidohydrolase [Pseudomonadota bacterium]
MKKVFSVMLLHVLVGAVNVTTAATVDEILADPALEQQVIDWRRYFHENPELSNREFNTAKRIANELRGMGLEPKTGIAHTGITALLDGGKPGPLVALRADMDGLPVVEMTDLPFRSRAKGEYRGNKVGVMHACGHDLHMAMLLGAAKTLTAMRDELEGSVLFIFQPAEEGAPDGEEGGAALMLKEGVFAERKPAAVFGLHVFSSGPAGYVGYRAGPAMAAADRFRIVVRGKQTHGSRPWQGVDPVVVAAQIITAAQTIVSRQTDIAKAPAVLSFGIVNGGVRNNIIPDEVELVGTIRNFDKANQQLIHERLEKMAKTVAEASGATADVKIDVGYPVTVNDPELTAAMLPTVRRVANNRVAEAPLVMGAEDFSYFAEEVPGLFLFLGVTPPDKPLATAPSNHSPLFYADESALMTGVGLLTNLTLDYMAQNPLN